MPSTTMRQQLMLLLIAAMALQLSQAFLLKLPKLEDLAEKLDGKQQKEALKKLDFLNLFTEKKENEMEKIKQFFEDKKLKQLEFFEGIKEKETAKLEEKISKKSSKKQKPKTTTECYSDHYTSKPTYAEHSYEERYKKQDEEEEDEEEEIQQPKKIVKEKPCACNTKSGYSAYNGYAPTAYDVRENYEDGIRYFT
ncbi:intersectin-1 [Drosophila grimshawi]|uniref:GH24676 n=1 Tax=Drosophila grimshawi TaxID=7222 RepID=B4JMR2_DROGR|nr:intersectin-1 [Drosophila grimshawi]EDV92005.1 GH24676 [Drosophila grimshawi]